MKLEKIRVRFFEFIEHFRAGEFWSLLGKRIYFGKTVMPVEMDLEDLPGQQEPLRGTPFQIISLSREQLDEGLRFFSKSRHLKAKYYLRHGFRGYGLIKGSLVVGYIWFACPASLEEKIRHPDLKWLRIENEAGAAYAFDMHIAPEYRGHGLSTAFQKAALYVLKKDGLGKVYGFYWTDFIPSLWMHRLLKWKELGKKRVWRFFFMRGSSPV